MSGIPYIGHVSDTSWGDDDEFGGSHTQLSSEYPSFPMKHLCGTWVLCATQFEKQLINMNPLLKKFLVARGQQCTPSYNVEVGAERAEECAYMQPWPLTASMAGGWYTCVLHWTHLCRYIWSSSLRAQDHLSTCWLQEGTWEVALPKSSSMIFLLFF